MQELRFAIRQMARRPTFALLATLTLALGISAVTAMYSVIYCVLLNPFPYTDPRRMIDVVVQDTQAGERGIRGPMVTSEFRAYVDESGVFEEAVGTNSSTMLYRTEHGNEQLVVAGVTPNTFHFLGVPALIGRTLNVNDAKPGSPTVGILSHKAWLTYFSGDPGVVGRPITLDDRSITVVGVMPPRFTWNVADVWMPDAADRGDPDAMKKGFWLQGRLKPGLTLAQAEARLNVIGKRLAQMYPERYPKRFAVKVIPVIDWVVGKFRRVLYTLFGAVGLLLLIACCNIANMLLARATTRKRELAIRAAVGASRTQIVRQLLVESALLALSGGLLGMAVAFWGMRFLVRLIPPYTIPVETDIAVRAPALIFTLGTAILTALLFGLAPALHVTRRDLAGSLASSGKGTDSGPSRGGLRNALIVCEVAMSIVLLTGAGALMRSFFSMLNMDLGFNPHNLIWVRAALPNATTMQKRLFVDAAVARLASLPGVIAAGASIGIPPYGGALTDIDIPGAVHTQKWTGQLELCDERYMNAVGFRLLEGSLLSRHDVASARKAAVVNQTFATKYFPNGQAIGHRIRLLRLASIRGGIPDPTFEVVGVVSDVRNEGVEEPAAAEAFVPFTTVDAGLPGVLVRTSQDAHTMSNALRREIYAVNAAVVQRDPMIIDDLLRDRSYARPRFSSMLLALFASIGLALVCSGVYGVMGHVVSSRTREIGIRMALGAERGRVFRFVLGAASGAVGMGLAAGALISIATNRIISTQVSNVGAFDPMVMAGAAAAIAVTGVLACAVPVVRAISINPVTALREE